MLWQMSVRLTILTRVARLPVLIRLSIFVVANLLKNIIGVRMPLLDLSIVPRRLLPVLKTTNIGTRPSPSVTLLVARVKVCRVSLNIFRESFLIRVLVSDRGKLTWGNSPCTG